MTSDWIRPSFGAQRSRTSSVRRLISKAAVAGALATAFWGSTASAEKLDFALERLAANSDTCRTPQGYSSGIEVCTPDDDAFINLVNDFGMAIAPSAMYDGRTTGYGGFEISFEGTFTGVDGDSDYMRRGTRGIVDPTTGDAPSINDDTSNLLQLYALRIRKGFGFGFETGLQFGFIPGTSLVAGGADLRMSLLEGFRDGVPGYLPDIAFTGSARTITGTSQVQLTVASASAVMSKPFTLAESAVLTPWVGFQHLFIFGDSGVIDFTPAESALQACGYSGSEQPGTVTREDEDAQADDGSPSCDRVGANNIEPVEDFNNNKVFTPVRLMRQRLIIGMKYRYEILSLAGQVMFDPFDSKEGLNSQEEAAAMSGTKNNLALSFQVGALF